MLPTSADFKLASRKRRFAAFVIDHFLFPFVLVSIIFLVIGTGFTNEKQTLKLAISIITSGSIGVLIYLSKDSIRGTSPGKWMMGITVKSEHDHSKTPAYYKLFLRNIFLLIWPVEAIVLATNDEKRRLGDKAAKAVVIQHNKKPKLLAIIAIILTFFISFFAFILLFTAAVLKNSDSYNISIAEIEQNLSIIEETGGIEDYGMFPGGTIRTQNGAGEAQLKITVLGKEHDVKVNVNLTKSPKEDWKIINLEYYPKD